MAQYARHRRFNADDLETSSIRSGAPSYVSEAPSYQSGRSLAEQVPAYTPRTVPAFTTTNQTPTTGLPPVPNRPKIAIPSLHNYRLPTWSTNNALAARHYQNVAARRVTDGRYVDKGRQSPERQQRPEDNGVKSEELRPLEDPYLVGEVAAAQARQERINRETGDDILIREDRQWDWLLTQMSDWDERDKSWKRFKRQFDHHQGKNLVRRIGGSRTNGFMS